MQPLALPLSIVWRRFTTTEALSPVGFAWWLKGHNRNIKASIGEQRTDAKPNRLQGLVQL